MDSHEYERLYRFEKSYWWHVGRRSIIRQILQCRLGGHTRPKILDVGCGTGGMLPLLEEFGEVVGIDHSSDAIRFCQKRGGSEVKLGSVESLPFAPKSFELVTMFDLLEHLEDDRQALRESFRVLKEGGYLLLTVPAYPFLWSEHDEALGHRRRYRVDDLRFKIREVGFEIEKQSFAVSLLLPPIIIYRLFRKLLARKSAPQTSYVILPSWLNGFFVKILVFEGWLLRWVRLPFGASIVCLARKGIGAEGGLR